MTRIRRGASIAMGLLMSLTAIGGGERAAAQSSPSPGRAARAPGVVVAETTSIEAKVDAVDVKTRRAMVTGPTGKTLSVKVGTDVRNLDQVKAGDYLVVRYFEPLALFIRKSTEPRAAAEGAAVQ